MVIRPQESHDLCVIPQPARKKDHHKRSDQPNGVSDTSMGPKFYPEAGPGEQKRQTTYCKIQKMVPLQEKIKEDKRIRIKNFTKRTALITNQHQLKINHDPHQ